jgi:hypothetical protein
MQTESGANAAFSTMCSRVFFHGINRPESDTDHSPSPNAEIKIEWSYKSSPHIRLHNEDVRHCVMILEMIRYLVSTPKIY